MIEYGKNQFGPILEFKEALKRLQEAVIADVPVYALHIGNAIELENRKKEASLLERVVLLEKKVAANPQSRVLHIPTMEEVHQFMKEEGR